MSGSVRGGPGATANAFGEAQYRRGAGERLAEAHLLLIGGRLSGSVYLAGRAVEGMLRALIWRHDSEIRSGQKQLETGHDLHQLLGVIRRLGVLTGGPADDRLA